MAEWRRSPECPECGDTLDAGDSSGTKHCDCGQWLWIEVDGDQDEDGPFNLFKVTREDLPDWREIEGDLRYHGGL